MKTKHFILFLLGLFVMSSCLISSNAQEKKIDIKDLPAKVLASFQKSYPKAEIKDASKETERGKIYYEIESVEGSINRDVTYLEDGTLAELETTIQFNEVPSVVKKSLKKNYPKAEVLKSEKVVEGNKVKYEFLIEKNKNRTEVVFNSKGKVVKVEKKNSDGDND
jgi:Putative beta-lactamase-inhibitor-like, PepSY-like